MGCSLPLFPGVEETHMSMARIRTEALQIIEIVLGLFWVMNVNRVGTISV